jgi:hypothetical protein
MATYSFLMRGDFEERVPNFNRLLDVSRQLGEVVHTDTEFANAYFFVCVEIDDSEVTREALFADIEVKLRDVPDGAVFEGKYIVRVYDGLSADPVLTLKGVPFPYD